ncbi:hypothetical protein [Plasticicumulans sp.]|uniref:hypothetical protein n=1 Tax=Plasticicumulans sp. TaxID=2307179 RepID=UPI00393CFE60
MRLLAPGFAELALRAGQRGLCRLQVAVRAFQLLAGGFGGALRLGRAAGVAFELLALLVEPREFLFQSLRLVLQAIALGTGGGDGPLQLGFLAAQAVDPFRGRLQFLLRLPEPPLGFLLLGQRRVAALLGLALLRPGAAFGLGGGTAALLGFAALAFGGFSLVVETGQRGFGIPDGAGEAIAPAAGGFQFGAVVGDFLAQFPASSRSRIAAACPDSVSVRRRARSLASASRLRPSSASSRSRRLRSVPSVPSASRCPTRCACQLRRSLASPITPNSTVPKLPSASALARPSASCTRGQAGGAADGGMGS